RCAAARSTARLRAFVCSRRPGGRAAAVAAIKVDASVDFAGESRRGSLASTGLLHVAQRAQLLGRLLIDLGERRRRRRGLPVPELGGERRLLLRVEPGDVSLLGRVAL